METKLHWLNKSVPGLHKKYMYNFTSLDNIIHSKYAYIHLTNKQKTWKNYSK